MAKLTNYSFLAGALIMVSSAVGCGGNQQSGGGNFASASLRVLVLNPSAGVVQVSVDGTMVSSNLPYKGDTGYVPIKTPGGQLSMAPSNSVTVAPFTEPLDLTPNSHNTFLLDGWAHFNSSSSLMADDNSPAPNSAAKLRILDVSLSVIRDIYLLPAGSTPSGTPLIALSAFNTARVLAEAGDPAYVKFGPEELFTKGFPDKLIVRSSPPEFCNPTKCSRRLAITESHDFIKISPQDKLSLP